NLSPIPAWAAAVDRIDARPQRFFTQTLAPLLSDAGTLATVLLAPDDNTSPNGSAANGAAGPTAPGKRLAFLRSFLPILRDRLAHKLVVDTMAGAAGLDSDTTEVLLAQVLTVGTPATPAIDALLAINNAPAGGLGWRGYLLVPASGSYTFVATDVDNQPADLSLNGAAVPLS